MEKRTLIHLRYIGSLIVFLLLSTTVGVHAQEILNPKPLEIVKGRKKPLDVRKGFCITDVQSAFSDDLGFLYLNEDGVDLKIDYGQKISQKKHVPQLPGSYLLAVSGKGVAITGFDEMGAYYGILTLHQLMMSSDGYLQCEEIIDSPSILYRGVMETFPCPSSMHGDRLRRLEQYALSKLNMYFYAPSDDDVRTSKGWKYPYQKEEMDNLMELVKTCEDYRMDFVWTIAPGKTYKDTEDDYKFLLNKLVLMYFSGIRSFALITDDAEFKPDIRERLQRDFVETRREKPTLYMYDDISWKNICVEFQDSTMLSIGPETFTDMPDNPDRVAMRIDSETALAKFKVFSFVDWSWNPYAYSAEESWNRSISGYVPEVEDYFRKFAVYADASGSTGSMKTGIVSLDDYNQNAAEGLKTEFEILRKIPDSLRICKDKALLKELKPWIIQMGLLGERGVRTLECMSFYKASDQISFLKSYVGTTMTEKEREEFSKNKVGVRLLYPFCEETSKELASVFYKGMNGAVVLRSDESVLNNPFYGALDGNLATFINCKDRTVFLVPQEAVKCHILFGESNGRVLFRQLSKDGKLIAELLVKNPYVEMEIKPEVTIIDILGEVELFETIFVN